MRQVILALGLFICGAIMAFVLVANVSDVQSSPTPSIYHGDLVLRGSNATVIEGEFQIEGSIILEDSASLTLRNAVLTFTQSSDNQFNITLMGPGGPRLLVDNSALSPNGHPLNIYLYGEGSAEMDGLTAGNLVRLYSFGQSSVEISNSSLGVVRTDEDSRATLTSCSVSMLEGSSDSEVNSADTTILTAVAISVHSANCSFTGIGPGFLHYWTTGDNSSFTKTPTGAVPNISLRDTTVHGWSFHVLDRSNCSISDSLIDSVTCDHSLVDVYRSEISNTLNTLESAFSRLFNSTCDTVMANYDSKVLLFSSTSKRVEATGEAEVYAGWYLHLHLIDSTGQDVPFTKVLAFQAGKEVGSWRTNEGGWAQVALPEKIYDAQGEHIAGEYEIRASHDSQTGTLSVTMTSDKELTLRLDDLGALGAFLLVLLLVLSVVLREVR